MELSYSEGELSYSRVSLDDNNSEEEEDMALNLRKRLKDLLPGKSKGSSSNETLKTQLPPNLPPPLPPSLLGLLPNPNLQRKKRKKREIEEGKIAPSKDQKQHKKTIDRT